MSLKLLPQFMFVQATVADQGHVGGGGGDEEAWKAVEEATTQDVGPEESP